jgi:hypothetical protein
MRRPAAIAPLASCSSRMSLCAQCDAIGQRQALIRVGQAAVGADQAQFEAACRRVHQPAAADAARRAAADDVAVEPAVAHVYRCRSRPCPPASPRQFGRLQRPGQPPSTHTQSLAPTPPPPHHWCQCRIARSGRARSSRRVATMPHSRSLPTNPPRQGRNSAGPGHPNSQTRRSGSRRAWARGTARGSAAPHRDRRRDGASPYCPPPAPRGAARRPASSPSVSRMSGPVRPAGELVLQAAHHVGPVARLRVERGLHPQHFARRDRPPGPPASSYPGRWPHPVPRAARWARALRR